MSQEEQDGLDKSVLQCARAVNPHAQIEKPVVKRGRFVILNSHLWHAAEAGAEKLRAISLYYTVTSAVGGFVQSNDVGDDILVFQVPECETKIANKPGGSAWAYARPPVMLVSGRANTLPSSLSLTNNFVHLKHLPITPLNGPLFAARWQSAKTKELLKWSTVWYPRTSDSNVVSNVAKVGKHALTYDRDVRPVFFGQTAGLSLLEIAVQRVGEHLMDGFPERTPETTINFVLDGSVKLWHLAEGKGLATSVFSSELRVPSLISLPPGGSAMVGPGAAYAVAGGADGGGLLLRIRVHPRNPHFEAPKDWRAGRSTGLLAWYPQLENETSFMSLAGQGFQELELRITNCTAASLRKDDHLEMLVMIESINGTLEHKGLALWPGALVFFPRGRVSGESVFRGCLVRVCFVGGAATSLAY